MSRALFLTAGAAVLVGGMTLKSGELNPLPHPIDCRIKQSLAVVEGRDSALDPECASAIGRARKLLTSTL